LPEKEHNPGKKMAVKKTKKSSTIVKRVSKIKSEKKTTLKKKQEKRLLRKAIKNSIKVKTLRKNKFKKITLWMSLKKLLQPGIRKLTRIQHFKWSDMEVQSPLLQREITSQ